MKRKAGVFQPLVPGAVKEEEGEDSDKDTLVVDEAPRAQQANRKNSAVKPGSLRVKLSSECSPAGRLAGWLAAVPQSCPL